MKPISNNQEMEDAESLCGQERHGPCSVSEVESNVLVVSCNGLGTLLKGEVNFFKISGT